MTPTIDAPVTEDERRAIASRVTGYSGPVPVGSNWPPFAMALLDALVREHRKVARMREAASVVVMALEAWDGLSVSTVFGAKDTLRAALDTTGEP